MVVIKAMIVPYQATRGSSNEIANQAMIKKHDLSITSNTCYIRNLYHLLSLLITFLRAMVITLICTFYP